MYKTKYQKFRTNHDVFRESIIDLRLELIFRIVLNTLLSVRTINVIRICFIVTLEQSFAKTLITEHKDQSRREDK